MKLLRGILKTVFILLVLGVLAHYMLAYLPLIPDLFSRPCTEPIEYKIENFDEKFGITREEFLSALEEAEAIWEAPTGKDLFTYAPAETGERILKVNLVYDHRQAATEKLEVIGGAVEDSQATYDALRARFESSRREYEKAKSVLDARVSAFNAKNSEYEKSVEYWNAEGGAPEEEFNKLEKDRRALEKEARELETFQNDVNVMAEGVNREVAELNRLAKVLNISVDKYNTINETRGETFEEGIYEEDGFRRAINIYEFSTRIKLVRVLAHELGHALGLDHVADEEAIMYEYNLDDSLSLSGGDIAELARKCEEE